MTVEDAKLLPKAVQPLNLPRFVLITGGVGIKALAQYLAGVNTEYAITYLRPSAEDLAAGFGLKSTLDLVCPDKTVEDYQKELMSFMESRLGPDIHALNFIRQEQLGWVEESFFIFTDTEHWDVIPFTEAYGQDNVLLLSTGQLKTPIHSCKSIWLPSPSLSERISLLRRELGDQQ